MHLVMGRLTTVSLLTLTLCAVTGCKTRQRSDAAPDASAVLGDGFGGDQPRLCAAIRGNGDKVMAHFASLARIVEHYGLIDAAAGGSSASASIFVYESITMNPDVRDCGAGPCSPAEAGARAGLLLKSIQGYLESLGDSPEAAIATQTAPLATAIQAKGIERMAAAGNRLAVKAMLALLDGPDLRNIVNPELIDLLKTSPDPLWHVQDLIRGLREAAEWKVTDGTMFVRPGLLNFRAVAHLLGKMADFYAGYGPINHNAMKAFLDTCTGVGRDLTWDQLAARGASQGASCGKQFTDIVTGFRKQRQNTAQYESFRLKQAVGQNLPALVTTSIFEGPETRALFDAARRTYLSARTPDFRPDFAHLRIGYWGRQENLNRVGENRQAYEDEKTSRFLPLGEASWEEVLTISPAEPGLSRILEMGPARLSAGGWTDLAPVLVLRNLGCEQVVYVQRRGEESKFAMGIARLLGMRPVDEEALYPLDPVPDRPESSLRRSLMAADAVWCTDWNNERIKSTDFKAIAADSYNAPLEARRPFFREGDETYKNPYQNARESVGLRGCTP